MGYNFPNTPVSGDIYSPPEGPAWTYSNGAWVQVVDFTAPLVGAMYYDSKAQAQASSIDPALNAIHLTGYYAAGDRGGALYKRVGAQPAHNGKLQSVDGAWWELVTDPATTVHCYGAKGDNTNTTDGTDDTAAIQSMINHLGFYRLDTGRYKITDKLTFTNSASSMGAKFSGAGKERSTLVAVSMAGKAMFGPTSSNAAYRLHMEDHGMIGDADRCADFTLTGGSSTPLNESTFNRMLFQSWAGSSFYTTTLYNGSFYGCSFSSELGHAVELGTTGQTVMTNCYAGKCGDGMGQFRISAYVTLVNCSAGSKMTGGCYGIWLGGAAGGAASATYYAEILGGIVENFGTAAIRLDTAGRLIISNMHMYTRTTGTFLTYIEAGTGNGHHLSIRGNVSASSRGATRTTTSNIYGTGFTQINNEIWTVTAGQNVFPDFYHSGFSLLYEIPWESTQGGEYAKFDRNISRLRSGRESGFIGPYATQPTVNATTFALPVWTNYVRTLNTAPTLFTNLTGAIEGQHLTFLFSDSFTTLRHNVGTTGRFYLTKGTDYVATSGDVLLFFYHAVGAFWRQVGEVHPKTASATVDPASLATGASTAVTTLAVTGAALGDFVKASFSNNLAGVSLHAWVSAADTVSYFFRNDAGTNPADLASGTLKVRVDK